MFCMIEYVICGWRCDIYCAIPTIASLQILILNYHQMRRFITLIDALYEESVQVVVLAEETPTKLLRLTDKERKSPHDEVKTGK